MRQVGRLRKPRQPSWAEAWPMANPTAAFLPTGPDAFARRSTLPKLPKGTIADPVHLVEDGRALLMLTRPPSVFLPMAERVGMMPKIDLWIINRLLRHLHGLKELKAPLAFNVNLSNMTLADPESLGLIAAAIKSSGVAAHQLIFEITETSELTSLHVARRFISELKKLGFEVILDPAASKLLIGRLPLEKLEALAELAAVKYIAPQM